MNTQIKEHDDLEDMTENEMPEEDIVPERHNLKRTLKNIVITILSLLCITGGVLIHKIHSLSIERNHYNSSVTIQKKKGLLPNQGVIQSQPETIHPITPMVLSPTVTPTSIPEATSSETEKESISSTAEVPVNQVMEETTPPNTTTEKQPETIITATSNTFSLRDALLFKEHFLTEESCFNDYQKLLNTPNKTQEALNVLNDLSPYCLTNQQPVDNVREAFLENKKRALIVSYKEKNPSWLAYIKAIPASIIEIRKVNPLKNKPKDILYKAQNEIYRQNVSKAVDFINQLPLSMQKEMKDFFREAAIYTRAKNSIDMLILSFEYKGE